MHSPFPLHLARSPPRLSGLNPAHHSGTQRDLFGAGQVFTGGMAVFVKIVVGAVSGCDLF